MIIAFLLGFVLGYTCVISTIFTLRRISMPYPEALGLIIGITVATIIALYTIDLRYLNAY